MSIARDRCRAARSRGVFDAVAVRDEKKPRAVKEETAAAVADDFGGLRCAKERGEDASAVEG